MRRLAIVPFVTCLLLSSGANAASLGDYSASAIRTVALLGMLIAIPVAQRKWRKWEIDHPDRRAMRWWYWYGYATCIALALCIPTEFIFSPATEATIFGAVALVYFALGALVVNLNRGAWIALTVLSFNPIVWIANGIYVYRRWHELTPTVSPSRPE
jgi:hypothetical protein